MYKLLMHHIGEPLEILLWQISRLLGPNFPGIVKLR